jgi:outer membrane immunogenic protein
LKNILAAAVAAVTLSCVPALAAPPAAPMFNWSGWYVGLNAGGDWGTSKASTVVSTTGNFFAGCPVCISGVAGVGNQQFNPSGFTGGIQGGYNWRSGNLVFGLEADFDSFRSAGSNSVSRLAFGATIVTISETSKTDWLFTLRPRLGVVANNWLFYATGGLAVTKLKGTWNYADDLNPDFESASKSSTKAGGAIGGGIETALPGNWVIGAEYLFVSFGRVSVNSANLHTGAGGFWTDVLTHTIDLNSNIVRLRLNKQY